jgi:pyruvate dehydrogenase (quinone)
MTQTVGDYLVRRLRDRQVEQVFAYPGDGINGIVAAFGKAGNEPRFVQARHEEMAALEAVGYAKFGGKVGVCMATSGPGAIHLLNGLYDAKLDHVLVVAIVGQIARSAMGYQQEVDLQSLYKDVASDYLVEVNVPEQQLPNALDRAIRTAEAYRAPTAVIIPNDVQEEEYTPPSGTLATMGPGVPYAIGAKFAHPDRPVIALVGDGAMQMNGMAELITIARYQQLWSDPRCVICVFHNNDLNQVTWELRAMGGAPKFEESQTLPDVNYAAFAQSLGLDAIMVDTPDQLADAWERALGASRATVLDVHCDPEVPPIPPHATFEQMKSVTESVLKGDPDAFRLMARGIKTKAQELLPGKRK